MPVCRVSHTASTKVPSMLLTRFLPQTSELRLESYIARITFSGFHNWVLRSTHYLTQMTLKIASNQVSGKSSLFLLFCFVHYLSYPILLIVTFINCYTLWNYFPFPQVFHLGQTSLHWPLNFLKRPVTESTSRSTILTTRDGRCPQSKKKLVWFYTINENWHWCTGRGCVHVFLWSLYVFFSFFPCLHCSVLPVPDPPSSVPSNPSYEYHLPGAGEEFYFAITRYHASSLHTMHNYNNYYYGEFHHNALWEWLGMLASKK